MTQVSRLDSLVKYWGDELRAGKAYRKKHGQPEKWQEYKEYYRGNWKGKDEIPVNKIFSFGRTMIPRTYFRSPSVSVTATRPGFEWHARIVEATDNYLIRELKLKKALKRGILDAFYAGVGPIKVGFDSQFGYLPKHAALGSGETVTQTSDKQEKTLIEYRSNIKPGMPWAVAVTPLDVITPWGCRDPEEFQWVAHEYLRPLRDVQEDTKYDKKGREALRGGWVRDADDPRAGEATLTSDYRPLPLCMVKEIRDRKHGRILIICEDQILAEEEDPLQIEDLPWEFITFNEDPDYFWGVPDVKVIEPQALELNQVRTQAMKHRRVGLLKILYRKGVIKEEDLVKLMNEDIEALAVDDQDIGMQQVVTQLQGHIPPDLWKEAQEILSDFRETIGFSRNEAGEYTGGTPPSAHEVAAVQGGSEIRSDERRDIVADVFTNIIRKWNQYIFKFWDKERVSKIVGPDGAQYWIKYTGEELQGEYRLNVDPDAGMPVTRQLRMQQSEKLFLQLKMDPFVDQVKLRELYIKQQSWIDPEIQLLIQNPLAAAKIQAMEAMNQAKGAGGGNGKGQPSSRTYGKPTMPMSVNEVMKGGA